MPASNSGPNTRNGQARCCSRPDTANKIASATSCAPLSQDKAGPSRSASPLLPR